MRICGLQKLSMVDFPGRLAATVFTGGCNLRCPWCHNPENLSAAPSELNYKVTGKKEILGKSVSAEEIIKELLDDKDYYDESDGGVTLSGGEAMLQAEEIVELASLLKENGVSVLIDTAGCVPYSSFEKLNPYISGYLFDFKTADADKYREIGGSLALVSENIKKLKDDGINIFIRIPLIPDFNTNTEEIQAICDHLRNINIENVELIPFHRLGSAKYDAMGLDYKYKTQTPLTKEKLNEIEENFAKYFTVKIER